MLLPVQSSWEQVRLCEWVSMCVRESKRDCTSTQCLCSSVSLSERQRRYSHALLYCSLWRLWKKVCHWPCSRGDRHWVSMIFQSPLSTALGLQICEVKDVGTLSQVFMLGQKVILSTRDSFSSGYLLLFFFTWKVNTFQRN